MLGGSGHLNPALQPESPGERLAPWILGSQAGKRSHTQHRGKYIFQSPKTDQSSPSQARLRR